MYGMAFNGLFSINTMFLSMVGIVLGVLLGVNIKQYNSLLFWLITALFISYLIGPLPYYGNLPISYVFFFSTIGILLGNFIRSLLRG
ncbi:MAG: energy-converting hydrogenase subunit [Methanothermococcus sp.]|jgi:energy-converting hydrogenase B subunit J|uniref:hypothetical protein n=1 Tax=Methanothermococcus TaxID=155862 RepID=UPI00035C390F|nr:MULTISPECIES: hypothetical protein [Methanothermococcus]MDK2790984.1 energy-converting hydrogenase subunit [Methanothermococcus sp.]MDK2987153.1 energy-converting hydrogenase subunit [Methanothermococcus sp.]